MVLFELPNREQIILCSNFLSRDSPICGWFFILKKWDNPSWKIVWEQFGTLKKIFGNIHSGKTIWDASVWKMIVQKPILLFVGMAGVSLVPLFLLGNCIAGGGDLILMFRQDRFCLQRTSDRLPLEGFLVGAKNLRFRKKNTYWQLKNGY